MKLAGEPEFPLLPISFNDLTALRSILSGYLAALRRTPGTQQRQKLIQVLESLPAEMEQKLFQFVRLFGLQYSSMDMILSQEGEYVWVEANPSGQFLWLAPPTGLPMAEAMANLLYNPEEYGLW